MSKKSHDRMFKILILGDSSVGKVCIPIFLFKILVESYYITMGYSLKRAAYYNDSLIMFFMCHIYQQSALISKLKQSIYTIKQSNYKYGKLD